MKKIKSLLITGVFTLLFTQNIFAEMTDCSDLPDNPTDYIIEEEPVEPIDPEEYQWVSDIAYTCSKYGTNKISSGISASFSSTVNYDLTITIKNSSGAVVKKYANNTGTGSLLEFSRKTTVSSGTYTVIFKLKVSKNGITDNITQSFNVTI